jgi:hypothetical protein
MIKKLFTLGLALVAFAGNAQQARLTKQNSASLSKLGGVTPPSVMATTNLGFETWSGGNPTGWTTLNVLGATCATQYTTSPGTGTSSLQLTTVSCPSCPTYGLPTKAGVAFQFVPYVGQPTTLSFQYKTAVAAGDTGSILVTLTAATNVTGQAGFSFEGTVSTWTTVTVPFRYANQANSDSVNIFIASSDSGVVTGLGVGRPVLGSKVYIDAIALNTAVGIQTIYTYSDYVMFPNPAKSELNFIIKDTKAKTVEVYNIAGVLVQSFIIENERTQIDGNNMSSGMYFYHVKDANGGVLHTDRFTVTK